MNDCCCPGVGICGHEGAEGRDGCIGAKDERPVVVAWLFLVVLEGARGVKALRL